MNSNDDTNIKVIQITIFGLLFIGFLINCFLLVHLYFSKMKYPYTCIPTYWLIIFLISLNINAIFPVIGIEIGEKNDISDIKILMQFIDLLLIKFLVMIPIIANYFSISQILKYNYYYLTRHIYHFGKEGLIKPNSYSKFFKKRYRYLKGFCFVYCLLFLFFVILYFFCKEDNNSLKNKEHFNNRAFQTIIKMFPLIFLSLYLLILSRIWKYQFLKDKYLLLFESIILFIIFFIETNTFFFALPFGGQLFQNELYYYLYGSIFNLLKTIIIALTTIIRRKRYLNSDDIINNKSLIEFLSKTVNFQMFTSFVKHKEKESINLLTFWSDYNMFVSIDQNVTYNNKVIVNKRPEEQRDNFTRTTSEDLIIKTGETTLKQKAMQIYNDYFKNANNSSNSYKSSSKYLIEFPPDISEKIEEYYKNGFEMDNLGSIYDGAYAFALEKLEKLHKNYKLQTSEIENLKKVTFFDEMLEIQM